jgi:hypothetical protein
LGFPRGGSQELPKARKAPAFVQHLSDEFNHMANFFEMHWKCCVVSVLLSTLSIASSTDCDGACKQRRLPLPAESDMIFDAELGMEVEAEEQAESLPAESDMIFDAELGMEVEAEEQAESLPAESDMIFDAELGMEVEAEEQAESLPAESDMIFDAELGMEVEAEAY